MPSQPQIPLFEENQTVQRLQAARERLMQPVRSAKTRDDYRKNLACFERWCAGAGRRSLPATPDTVSLYLAWLIEGGKLKYESIDMRLKAIRAKHLDNDLPTPVTPEVRKMMANFKRELALRDVDEDPPGKLALTMKHLQGMSHNLLKRVELGEKKAVCERSALLLGFALGWRRSELVGLNLSDVKFSDDRGGVTVRLRRSKTDQEGEGFETFVPRGKRALTCPIQALEGWLALRGTTRGPLWVVTKQNTGPQLQNRMKSDTVYKIIKRGLRAIGEDATRYGAHSLRAGLITTAAENGADVPVIMKRTGHKHYGTVLRYIRGAEALKADPLRGVL